MAQFQADLWATDSQRFPNTLGENRLRHAKTFSAQPFCEPFSPRRVSVQTGQTDRNCCSADELGIVPWQGRESVGCHGPLGGSCGADILLAWDGGSESTVLPHWQNARGNHRKPSWIDFTLGDGILNGRKEGAPQQTATGAESGDLCVVPMSDDINPYQSPSAVDTVLLQSDEDTHRWNGRTFTVSAHAAAPLLWMDIAIRVTIDDGDIHQQKAFHAGCSFRFQFAHDGEMIHAHVKPAWGVYARRINYELMIDGAVVARSRTRIDQWGRGVAIMLAANLVVFA